MEYICQTNRSKHPNSPKNSYRIKTRKALNKRFRKQDKIRICVQGGKFKDFILNTFRRKRKTMLISERIKN